VVEGLSAHPQALGFSLRLGRNTTCSYSFERPQRLPQFQPAGNANLSFLWPEAEADFGYPLEVSSSAYRTGDLVPLLNELDFENPNTLEAQMAAQAARYRLAKPFLLCAPQSIAFCAPINKVQEVFPNRAGARPEYSAQQLAALFFVGRRIDVNAYSGFLPQACHQEVELAWSDSAPMAPIVSVVVPCY
jgi:hypothetical protein